MYILIFGCVAMHNQEIFLAFLLSASCIETNFNFQGDQNVFKRRMLTEILFLDKESGN